MAPVISVCAASQWRFSNPSTAPAQALITRGTARQLLDDFMSLGPTAVTTEALVAEPVEDSPSNQEQEENDDSGANESPMLEAAIKTSDPVLAEMEEHTEPQHLSPELELPSYVLADSPSDVAVAPEVDDAAPTCGPPLQTPALAHVTGASEAASASSSDSQFSMGQRARGGGAQGQAGGRSSASRKKSAAKRPGIR